MKKTISQNKTYKLIRTYKEEATIGIIVDSAGKKICCTLEPPNRNNAKDNPKTKDNEAGCIPEGIYTCRKRNPLHYPNARFKDNWEVLDVLNKSGVVFHTGNVWTDSKSCIILATEIQDMNPRNIESFNPVKKWWASQSRTALGKFNKMMPEEFALEIMSIS